MDLNFYRDKKVLITGNTGFKGSWMTKILLMHGAEVIGYSLEAPTNPSLFNLLNLQEKMTQIIGDIRDFQHLDKIFELYQPEIVFHLAAQPIVRESYKKPVYTYETNVMGTVNILEVIRLHNCVKSFVNITTDKVYQNKEWEWGYREIDRLDGYDPYSNSKACSELITNSYKNSFFIDRDISISTCRAGNVIGGGDFATDRIIPDCIRAQMEERKIEVRNPNSIRPYQHVLEPVCAYLELARLQYQNKKYAGSYNIGPEDADCITTGELVDLFCKSWGEGAEWCKVSEYNPVHEASFLKLDCSKIKKVLGWKQKWDINNAILYTVQFGKVLLNYGNIEEEIENEIREYIEGREEDV